MSWPDVMEDINYEDKNFKLDEVSLRHPLWMTEGHYIYHLLRDTHGHLSCRTDNNGEPICSPRYLSQLSIMKLVCDPSRMRKMKSNDIPGDLFPGLLTEAILQKELISIEFLVSNWPHQVLDLQALMPLEDYLQPGYLTQILGEGHGNMSLLDCIMMGLINLKTESPLRTVNFTGFKNDKKLCRELTRLPILWLHPNDRKVDYIHGIISKTIEITPDRVLRYLNRIASIYSNMDPYIKHGNNTRPIKISINCKVTLDDVPIGIVLQEVTPFRFDCTRLWMEPIAEIYLPLRNIPFIINAQGITHLEIEDQNLCADPVRFNDMLEGLLLLPDLIVLSLPNTIHVNDNLENIIQLNQILQSLTKLKKLNLPSCNLRDSLELLIGNLTQLFDCLNLRDCRLNETDLVFLVNWPLLPGLHELNLSRNNLKSVASICVSLLEKMPRITCFSISYCCLGPHMIQRVTEKCSECLELKTLAIQTFTPLPFSDVRDILHGCAQIKVLQICTIVPETYAFPGADDEIRMHNRELFVASCQVYLQEFGRPDIEIE